MTRRRTSGDRGIAIMVTALLLIPMMIFAAFGVDLASWYSRISFLQQSADAAALAGTVWMPSLPQSTVVACASLKENGITGGDCGTGPFGVTVARGSTPTSLRVTVTDPNADQIFAQVLKGHESLTRSAEAEYNLPIPLGSPLNYFGGDATHTTRDPITTYALNWPVPSNDTVGWPPANLANNSRCNVGTSADQNFGGWRKSSSGVVTFVANDFSTSRSQCAWTVRTNPGTAGSTTTPPAGNFLVTVPTNGTTSTGCWIDSNGTSSGGSSWGRWANSTFSPTFTTSGTRCSWGATSTPAQGTLPTNSNACQVRSPFGGTGGTFWGRYSSGSWVTTNPTSGSNPPACTWTTPAVPSTIVTTLPSVAYRQGTRPLNQPCNVGIEATYGRWASNTFVPNSVSGTTLCQWNPDITTTVTPVANPINAARSPGFWAQIEGPSTIATNGDVYSTRCYTTASCTTDQNQQYKPLTDTDRGYWYVVKIPAVAVGSIDINVFDASHTTNGDLNTNAGDRSFATDSTFPTDFKVYRQTNPLDFTSRTAVFANATGNQTDGSCNWDVSGGSSTAFTGVWRRLCTITAPTAGATYLIQVSTPGTTGNGVNGYALEAVTGGDHSLANQPALYAYANMGMYNNNSCSPTPCDPPPATFYLAEVGPQYAGRTLVVDLWDPGDVASGNASMYPKMPSTTDPKPVTDVPADICSYTSSPAPNVVQTGADPTGATYATAQPSDDATRCGITTATSGTKRFNGTWLTIRIDIPADYTCTVNSAANPINPEVDPGSCWWGIEYNFSQASQDVTTWQARIEGNPVHLTQ